MLTKACQQERERCQSCPYSQQSVPLVNLVFARGPSGMYCQALCQQLKCLCYISREPRRALCQSFFFTPPQPSISKQYCCVGLVGQREWRCPGKLGSTVHEGWRAIRKDGDEFLASAVLQTCSSAISWFPIPLIPPSFPWRVIVFLFYFYQCSDIYSFI